jgi:hypothetical protein
LLRFFVVFLNSHRGETPETAIKQKESRGKTDIEILSIFPGEVLDMDFL